MMNDGAFGLGRSRTMLLIWSDQVGRVWGVLQGSVREMHGARREWPAEVELLQGSIFASP